MLCYPNKVLSVPLPSVVAPPVLLRLVGALRRASPVGRASGAGALSETCLGAGGGGGGGGGGCGITRCLGLEEPPIILFS